MVEGEEQQQQRMALEKEVVTNEEEALQQRDDQPHDKDYEPKQTSEDASTSDESTTSFVPPVEMPNTFSSPSSYGPKNRITSVSLANFDVKSKIQWFEALSSPPHSSNNNNNNAMSPNSKKKHRVALKHRHQQGASSASTSERGHHRFHPSSYSSSSSGRRGIKPATATCCPSPMVANGNKTKASLVNTNSPAKTSSPTFSAIARGKKQCWEAVRRSRQFAAQKMSSILSSPTSALGSPSHQPQQRAATFSSPTTTTATTTTTTTTTATSTPGFALSPPTKFYRFSTMLETNPTTMTTTTTTTEDDKKVVSNLTEEDEMVLETNETSPRQVSEKRLHVHSKNNSRSPR